MKPTIRQRLADFYQRHRNRLIAALKVGLLAFLADFMPNLLGFMSEISQWADPGSTGPFPSIAPLGKATVAAFTGALAAVGSLVVNALQARGMLPGQPPTYAQTHVRFTGDDRGEITLRDLVLLGALILIVVAIWALATGRLA